MTSEYNLRLSEAMAAMIDDGVRVEQSNSYGVFYYDANNYCFRRSRDPDSDEIGTPCNHWQPGSHWRVEKQEPELVTWWAPVWVWYKGNREPQIWRGDAERSKEEFYRIHPKYKVLIWGSIEAPETFEGIE